MDVFINRYRLLKILGQALKNLQLGSKIDVALIGMRRIGKTQLLLEFKKRIDKYNNTVCIYLNLQNVMMSPRDFTIVYFGTLLRELSIKKKIKRKLEDFLDYHKFVSIAGELGKRVKEFAEYLQEVLNRRNPDYVSSIRALFQFPEGLGLKVVVCFDEFQELLGLNTYPGIHDIISLMRANIEKQKNTAYIISGSTIRLIEHILTDPKAPFFAQFRIEKVGPFTKEDNILQVRQFFKDRKIPYDDNTLFVIYQYTFGHPGYTDFLLKRIETNLLGEHKTVTSKMVEYAFLNEVLESDGQINTICRYIYETSLERVRGKGSLKEILGVLAYEDSLTLSEIADKIHKKSGSVSFSLNLLLDTDLIIKESLKYYFRDPILRFWLAKTILGVERVYKSDIQLIKNLIVELHEKYLRISTELGLAKESQVRELISNIQGKILPGKLFGQIGKVKIPKFNNIKNLSGRKKEIDIWCENKEKWAVEIKWKNQIIDTETIKSFINKIEADKYWFISKSGFLKEAREFALSNKVLISDQRDLVEIEKYQ